MKHSIRFGGITLQNPDGPNRGQDQQFNVAPLGFAPQFLHHGNAPVPVPTTRRPQWRVLNELSPTEELDRMQTIVPRPCSVFSLAGIRQSVPTASFPQEL